MKLKFAGVVAAAAFAVALSGCGEPSTGGTGGGAGGGGGGSKFCTSTSCAAGQVCHPSSKTCVKTCNFGTDCTSEAKTCDVAVGSTATAGADGGQLYVCSCLTTALCSGSSGVAGNICSTVDKVCVGKCTSNSDCPNNRTCDTGTGQCGGTGGNDAGTMDAGSGCTRGSCTGTQVCNFQTNACEAPKACVTSNAQPDVCGYGQFCNASSCAEVAVGTCSNFAAGSNPTQWNPKVQMGAVIYSITKVSFGTDAVFCGANPVRAKFHVKAYSATNQLISETNQPSLNYVRTDGNEIAITMTQIQAYTSTGGGKAAEFDINLCAPTGTNSLTAGFYYTTGNAACFTIN
jgi:hypothetical protein